MRHRITRIATFTLALVLTLATLLLVTAWDFRPIDLALLAIFAAGIGVGVWATRVWYGLR